MAVGDVLRACTNDDLNESITAVAWRAGRQELT